MFNKPYEDRLTLWREFRESLEVVSDPINAAIQFYSTAPKVTLNADPWNREAWPTPWELLQDNEYCNFTRVLGICYSLQLTDCFKESQIEIHIYTDSKKGYVFLLLIDNHVIGWEEDAYVDVNDLPKDLVPQRVYSMSTIQ
jgi:hypothetical protein